MSSADGSTSSARVGDAVSNDSFSASVQVRECAGMTPDERGHNDGVRRLARDALVALVALVLWPLTVALGLGVLSTRAWRRERLFSQRDVVWLGRGAVVSAGAVLTLWLVATVLVALASVFVAIPDV